MLKLILCLLTVLSFATVAYAKDAPQMSVPFPLGRDISDHFVGTVHRNDIIMADDVYKLPQTNVITFELGSHSGWHVHGAMTVIGLAGTGVCISLNLYNIEKKTLADFLQSARVFLLFYV